MFCSRPVLKVTCNCNAIGNVADICLMSSLQTVSIDRENVCWIKCDVGFEWERRKLHHDCAVFTRLLSYSEIARLDGLLRCFCCLLQTNDGGGISHNFRSSYSARNENVDLFWLCNRRLGQASLLHLRTFQIIHFYCRIGDDLMLLWQKQRTSLFLNVASLPVTSSLINLFFFFSFAINLVSYWTLVCSFLCEERSVAAFSVIRYASWFMWYNPLHVATENWKQFDVIFAYRYHVS